MSIHMHVHTFIMHRHSCTHIHDVHTTPHVHTFTYTVTNKTSASYLTLRRLLPWLRPSLHRLRLLCAMAETTTLLKVGYVLWGGIGVGGDWCVCVLVYNIIIIIITTTPSHNNNNNNNNITQQGGALVTAIHGFAQHGDQQVATFASSIFAQVSRPLLDMVRVWLAEGRLEDPCGEFFIVREEAGRYSGGSGAEGVGVGHGNTQPGMCGWWVVWVFISSLCVSRLEYKNHIHHITYTHHTIYTPHNPHILSVHPPTHRCMVTRLSSLPPHAPPLCHRRACRHHIQGRQVHSLFTRVL